MHLNSNGFKYHLSIILQHFTSKGSMAVFGYVNEQIMTDKHVDE